MQKTNQFKIIEFFDFKKNVNKMLAEMDTFLALLVEDGAYKDAEDNIIWIIQHQNVDDETKLAYTSRIHNIDKFYNPYTKIEKVFSMMLGYQGNTRPYSSEMQDVALKVLAFLERQNWRKDLHSAVNQLNQNKGALDDFIRYCKSAVPATEVILSANPSQTLFGGDKDILLHFVRAIMHKTYSL